LERLVRQGEPAAREVRARFVGEFESAILAGGRGEQAADVARQFSDSFIDVAAGQFRMGSPEEKQGMPEDLRREWEDYPNREGDPAELAGEYLYPFNVRSAFRNNERPSNSKDRSGFRVARAESRKS
jgi:hypothetical protein